MIIAKIRRKAPTRPTAGSEFAYVARLSRYIVRADPADLRKLAAYGDHQYLRDLATYVIAEGRAEEVLATGSRNLLARSLEDQQTEMQALMHRCPDAAGALDHYVFSWAEGEEPSTDDIEKTINIFLRCQKLEQCPVIWGYHGDTGNRHVHLAILRIDCRTAERQTAGDGWDIDTAHRAKAVIENAFPHWQREAGSIYGVADGMLVDKRTGKQIGPADKPMLWDRPRRRERKPPLEVGSTPKDLSERLDLASREYEQQTGFKSRARIALEVAVPLALKSTSWIECHRLFAEQGIALERTRYGANFIIEGKRVKASIDRRTSYGSLKKRFGGEEYVPSPYQPKDVPQREMWPNDTKRREYFSAKREYDDGRQALLRHFRQAHGGRSHGVTKDALEAARSAASFPSYDEWIAGVAPPDFVEVIASAMGFGVIKAQHPLKPHHADPRPSDFRAIRLRDRVVYYRPSDPPGRPAFVDLGDRVLVNAASDRKAVRAALLLAARGDLNCHIAVFGDKAFKKLALEIATEEGIALAGALGRRQERKRRKGQAEASQGQRDTTRVTPTAPISRREPPEQGEAKSPLSAPPPTSAPEADEAKKRAAEKARLAAAMAAAASRLM